MLKQKKARIVCDACFCCDMRFVPGGKIIIVPRGAKIYRCKHPRGPRGWRETNEVPAGCPLKIREIKQKPPIPIKCSRCGARESITPYPDGTRGERCAIMYYAKRGSESVIPNQNETPSFCPKEQNVNENCGSCYFNKETVIMDEDGVDLDGFSCDHPEGPYEWRADSNRPDDCPIEDKRDYTGRREK